ncbi:MAG: hypothetical protein ACRELY_17010 [Polyangiaceae bacterium]
MNAPKKGILARLRAKAWTSPFVLIVGAFAFVTLVYMVMAHRYRMQLAAGDKSFLIEPALPR